MIKILICGATGFIGRNLVNYFSEKSNCQIFATYNQNKPFENSKSINKIIWIKANLLMGDDISRALRDKDVVIQAAATTSGAKDIIDCPYIHVTDNAVMNSLLLREAMNSKIKHFIFFSCSVMYPDSNYAIKESDWNPSIKIKDSYFGAANTKIYIEKMLEFYSKISDMKTTAIRHSNVYGPFDKFDLSKSHVLGASISKVLTSKEKIKVWGDGKEKRDLLYVSDLCVFVDKVISHQKSKYKLYNCGSGSIIPVRELIEKIIKEAGKELKIVFDYEKPTIKSKVLLDFGLASKEIGWTPSINLEVGIRKTIKWWKENIDPKTLQLKD